MAEEKPVQPGTDSGFPPSDANEAPEDSTIGSTNTTATGDGTIGSATSTADNLADCLPNVGE